MATHPNNMVEVKKVILPNGQEVTTRHCKKCGYVWDDSNPTASMYCHVAIQEKQQAVEEAKRKIDATINELIRRGRGKVEIFIIDGKIDHANVTSTNKFK